MLGSLWMTILQGDIWLGTLSLKMNIDILIAIIGIDHSLIPDFIQENTNQDNVKDPST